MSARSGGSFTDGRSRYQVSPRKRVPAVEVRRNLHAAGARQHGATGGDLARGVVGHVAVYCLQRRVGLFHTQGRPGNGGGDPDLHPRHRLGACLPAALHPAGEHDHHGHGGRLRGRGVRRRLHPAGTLHSPPRSASGADHLHLPGRRLPGRALPHSAAALLCPRDARQVPISRGDGDHRSPCHGREGRIASQTTAAGYRHRRHL